MLCYMFNDRLLYILWVLRQRSGSQQVNPDNVVKADSTYYQSLGLAGTPTLTVYKHKAGDLNVPVQGVEFKTTKNW